MRQFTATVALMLLAGCAVFRPPSPEAARAMEAHQRWMTPGAKPAMTMQDLIDLGLVHRPEPCEPLVPTCIINP